MINRCPLCRGITPIINRFNHNRFHDCPLCKGKGRIKMRIINAYTLDELCNEHKSISIETQNGVVLNEPFKNKQEKTLL